MDTPAPEVSNEDARAIALEYFGVIGDPELQVAAIDSPIFHAGAVAPEISIQEHVAGDSATFDTGKDIAAKGLARLEYACPGQRWPNTRRAEIR